MPLLKVYILEVGILWNMHFFKVDDFLPQTKFWQITLITSTWKQYVLWRTYSEKQAAFYFSLVKTFWMKIKRIFCNF